MNPQKDRAACGRSGSVSCSGFTNGKDISKSDINTNCTSSDVLSDEVQFALGDFVLKHLAGDEIPQGELGQVQLVRQPFRDGRNAEGGNEKRKNEEHDPAHRCPPMNRIRKNSVSTMQPSSRTADATQNRNVTIAASRRQAIITGAAGILRTIIAAASIKNRVGLSFYSYYTAGKIGTQGCRSSPPVRSRIT